jgi:hypothetical protein
MKQPNARIKLPEQNYANDKFSMRDMLIPVSLNELLDLGLRQSFNSGILTLSSINSGISECSNLTPELTRRTTTKQASELTNESYAPSGRVE